MLLGQKFKALLLKVREAHPIRVTEELVQVSALKVLLLDVLGHLFLDLVEAEEFISTIGLMFLIGYGVFFFLLERVVELKPRQGRVVKSIDISVKLFFVADVGQVSRCLSTMPLRVLDIALMRFFLL